MVILSGIKQKAPTEGPWLRCCLVVYLLSVIQNPSGAQRCHHAIAYDLANGRQAMAGHAAHHVGYMGRESDLYGLNERGFGVFDVRHLG